MTALAVLLACIGAGAALGAAAWLIVRLAVPRGERGVRREPRCQRPR